MAHAAAMARQAGAATLSRHTNIHMTANLPLYPHPGVVETPRRTDAGFGRVFFRKPLQSR